MKLNRLGQSDLFVSEIGLGCMSLGTSFVQAQNLVENALDLGVNFFDTSDLYDKGINEKFLGRILKERREKVIISTKVGNRWNDDGKSWRWDPSPEWIYEAVHDSLDRLQTDYIDLYQLHGGTIDDPIDEIITAFERLQRDGIIRAYGISSIRPNVIQEWVRRSRFTTNMMQYSLLDRRPEEKMLDFLRKNKVSVIARGPVAKGLLADKPARAYLDHSQEDVERIQNELDAFTQPKRSRAQVALRYAMAHSSVASIIPGASNLNQLQQNLLAQNSEPLSPTELQSLKALTEPAIYAQHR